MVETMLESSWTINTLTAGHDYIRFFIIYARKSLSKMLNIKRDINKHDKHDFKIVYLNFVKSE